MHSLHRLHRLSRERFSLLSIFTRAASSSSKLGLKELSERTSLQGKRVLVRADLNVPLKKSHHKPLITDDTRIRAVLPTLNLLKNQGAKIILCSHFGRPDGKVNDSMRLDPVALRLSELLGSSVDKLDDCIGDEVSRKVGSLDDGQILLLENVRFHPEETKNDDSFAKKLAHGADIFVNDAFGTAHRAHASTAGVAKYIKTSVAGFLMEKELKYLAGSVEDPIRPLGAIIGGAKVSTKITVLESLLSKCDRVFLGGGMIFTFYKAMGYNVGKSIVEDDKLQLAKSIMKKAEDLGVELLLPTDVVVADKVDADAESRVVPINAIPSDWFGLDIGPKTTLHFAEKLQSCRTIVWNGPMGVFEIEKFAEGTLKLANVLANLTDEGCTTIIGGGDSVAAAEEADVTSRISHISTGGGASLELLEGKTLPGVAALSVK
ncbi:unnamed protein product [Albugo candida]|nr:unnamed protein product [Albugo candida]|eukprot:CCI47678.1 unnamed protein product [Albugo candida]